jgi:hypothetical protein
MQVKCTLVQALRLCTGCMAHRGSKGIALLFHDHGNRRGWGVSVTPRLLFTPGKDPIPIVQEAGWAPGPVWTGAENFAPTGIQSPNHPACSQSLYQLRYLAHRYAWSTHLNLHYDFMHVPQQQMYANGQPHPADICITVKILQPRMRNYCFFYVSDEYSQS